ncbi:MAG: glycerophosphodiester phosphodiesterase [Polyangiaceae bacterium]|nr:glycerophosphodiester phosphodiesterase [Polyangiaceae bacterium]
MIWSEARFRRRPGQPPLVIGHRGVGPASGPGAPPENTLAAFEEAARAGADAIELDVRPCASGELVVLHDPDLRRATSGADEREAAALPYEELRRVDVGGERVPRLSEALALARGLGIAMNVEVKRDVPDRLEAARAAARLLRGWDPAHAVLVSSFDPAMLAAIGALAPRGPRALLVHRTRWHEAAVRLAPALGVAGLHLQRTITQRARIEALRRRGLFVSVWTVNDPTEARDLAELGVDGIITDAPRVIRGALEGERGRAAPQRIGGP